MKIAWGWIATIAIALVALTASSSRADDNADHAAADKAELARLQGEWRVTSGQVRGEASERIEKLGLVFTFKDDTLKVTASSADYPIQERHLRLNVNSSPKSLDFAETPKALAEHKDVVEGVYTLDANTLEWCFNLDGDKPAKGRRPAAVESKADSSAVLLKLERVKN